MPKLILIVDDDAAVGDTISYLCRASGYSVNCFRDPQELIAALPSLPSKPELLITDYQMPKMNGLELIQYIKSAMPEVKTISVSGALMESDLAEYPVRPDAILPKPFQRAQLADLIKRLIDENKPS